MSTIRIVRIMRILALSTALLVISGSQRSVWAAGPSKQQRPNIVLFLVDDLGWTELGCFGSPLHQTPHVDRLARSGVRFTNAYAPACSCSPSRAGIMTGKYPARLGMTAIVEKYRGDRAPDDAPLLPATTDGQSLQALSRDPDRATPRRTLFWHYPHFSTMGGRPSAAIRQGKWKLLEKIETGELALYDLEEDISETTDLSKTHPDKVKRLHQSLVDWRGRRKALLPSRPNPNYKGPR